MAGRKCQTWPPALAHHIHHILSDTWGEISRVIYSGYVSDNSPTTEPHRARDPAGARSLGAARGGGRWRMLTLLIVITLLLVYNTWVTLHIWRVVQQETEQRLALLEYLAAYGHEVCS